MQLAALLLATATLTVPLPSATDPPPASVLAAPPSAAPTGVGAATPTQQPYSSSGRSRTRPRGFGIGANISAGVGGIGGSLRYWFGDRVGTDLTAAWYRGRDYGSTDQTSSFIVAPSVIVVLRPSDVTREVDVRPYLGGGVNFARASSFVSPGEEASEQGSVGMQIFGGVEMTMADAPNVSFSAEVAYYRLPDNFFNATAINGTTFQLGVHVYF